LGIEKGQKYIRINTFNILKEAKRYYTFIIIQKNRGNIRNNKNNSAFSVKSGKTRIKNIFSTRWILPNYEIDRAPLKCSKDGNIVDSNSSKTSALNSKSKIITN